MIICSFRTSILIYLSKDGKNCGQGVGRVGVSCSGGLLISQSGLALLVVSGPADTQFTPRLDYGAMSRGGVV